MKKKWLTIKEVDHILLTFVASKSLSEKMSKLSAILKADILQQM